VRRRLTPWFFLALPLAIYTCMIAYPTLYSIVLSLYEWDGISPTRQFVALGNYLTLYDRGSLAISFKNTFVWMALFVPIPIVSGFLLAVALQKETRLNVLLRSLFYLPMILSSAVAAIMWGWVYEPTQGVITQLLTVLHIHPPVRSFLTRPDTAMAAMALVGIWHWVGFPLVLYLAAIKDIPRELLEAAESDGATRFQKIRHIVIPLVGHATMIAASIGIVLSVKVFDLVYLMAGRYYKNDVLSTLVWRLAFDEYKVGQASAVSVIQFLIIVILVVPYVWRRASAGEVEL
jgi:ABC-type sugar transport system permease subunit